MPAAPPHRIALLHALRESVEPIRRAFAEQWPEAETVNLLDDSLSVAVAARGAVDAQITGRFLELARYAARERLDGRGGTSAILYTCSAFGPAIEAVQRELTIPVHKPNQAAFELALSRGPRIALLVTFAASLPPLERELRALASARGSALELQSVRVDDALAALQSGRPDEHDRLIAAAATAAGTRADVLVLGQFSMARARAAMHPALRERVITTPDSAVAALKRELCA